MSYEVRQPSVSAAVGAGLGSGLSEQIPREVERYRLSSGLSRFADESKDLDPMQAMARLSAIPGITPQMIQTAGELLKRRAYGGALRQRAGQYGEESPLGGQRNIPREDLPKERESFGQEGIERERGSFLNKNIGAEDISTLVSPESVEAGLRPEIPLTEEEIRARAQQLPYYEMDPQGSMQIIRDEDASRVARNENLIKAGQIQEAQQQKISSGLRSTADRFGGVGPDGIPENVYLNVENEAIDAVARGQMTPDQAAKKFSKNIEEIGRDYNDVKGLGNWLMAWGNPAQTLDSIKNLRKNFEKRGDLRNLRDSLVAQNGLSWPMASSQTYPVKKNKPLYGFLKNIPKID